MTLFCDLETFSTVPITHGAHRYAEEAEILLFAFADGDAPVEVWDMTASEHSLSDVQILLDGASSVTIQNSAFDRTVLRHCGVHLDVAKITDTMVLAFQHSLPGKLEMLGDVLGLDADQAKDKRGKRLIQLFTKPRPKNTKIRRATRETHPDEWQEFIEYAARDVDAMRSILPLLPRWNDTQSERELWLLDQKVNDFGFATDTLLAESALRAFKRASRTLADAASAATDGAVTSTTRRALLLDHLKTEHGLELADLQKATVEKLLAGDLSKDTRALLENRQQAAATSPAKYQALLNSVSSDGRLRGTLQFCGAGRTARDSGRIYQPQNLPRCPDWFDGEAQEATVAAFKADAEDLLYGDVVDRCTYAIRGSMMAPAGRKLVVADLSNIEGRVLAWIAGEAWKIEAFKAYDRGEGHDLYKVTAGRILGKPAGDVTKAERQTQGKVPELAGGYQGALGAYRKMGGPVFEAMSDEAILEIVKAWRAAHPMIVKLWYACDAAARAAIANHDESFSVRDMLVFSVIRANDGEDWLRVKLPSGRYLSYRAPLVEVETCERCDGEGTVEHLFEGKTHTLRCSDCGGEGSKGSTITFEGLNQYTRQWARLKTYGGSLVENITQATARDVFMAGFKRAEGAGYTIVSRIHDELVAEVPDTPEFNAEHLSALMATNDLWNIGLPLAAAGDDLYRYRKT